MISFKQLPIVLYKKKVKTYKLGNFSKTRFAFEVWGNTWTALESFHPQETKTGILKSGFATISELLEDTWEAKYKSATRHLTWLNREYCQMLYT